MLSGFHVCQLETQGVKILKHQLKLGCQVGTPLSCQESGKKKIANTHLHVACEGGIEGKRAGLLGVNPNPNKTGANR